MSSQYARQAAKRVATAARDMTLVEKVTPDAVVRRAAAAAGQGPESDRFIALLEEHRSQSSFVSAMAVAAKAMELDEPEVRIAFWSRGRARLRRAGGLWRC